MPEISGADRTLAAMQSVGQDEIKELSAEQNTSKLAFRESCEEATNPMAAKYATKRKPLDTHKNRISKMLEAKDKAGTLPIEAIKKTAEEFQKKNPELKAAVLSMLREYIKPGDSAEEILKKVMEFYQDVSLADEALEFLLETTDGELHGKVMEAKEKFNEQFGREISAGRNIGEEARLATEKGLGTPTSMRDMYRDVTGNPRDSNALFNELSSKYNFEDLTKVAKFLLHSMGADMKAKGPSIPRGELHRLMTEVRSLQAILGVYRFFKGRMGLVNSSFAREGLTVPKELNFENLSKSFMALCQERYPTGDKVLAQAGRLGVSDGIKEKIIAFSQLRDAIRQVAAGRIYRSTQHRDELFNALIEGLEELEEELEELLEQEDEDEEIT
jgi:type III secretion protein W